MKNIRILPPDGILEATIELPLSKSMSARALVINHLLGACPDIELSDCDDTRALQQGLEITQGEVNTGAAGTAMRFLTAVLAATPGTDVTLDGSERMRQRPMAELIEALRTLGADITCIDAEGHAPMHIRGRKLKGGTITIDPHVSSQFISALMMIAPVMDTPLTIRFEGDPASMSYVKLTASMMATAGVDVDIEYGRVLVPNTPYTQPITTIERDWSAASYWYAITALSAGWITLPGLSSESAQGDRRMIEFGAQIGVDTNPAEDEDENPIDGLALSASPEQFSRLDLDLSDNPDVAQTLAVAASTLGIPFRLTGLHTLRNKETDRLEALRAEALKLGAVFEIEGNDTLTWEGMRHPIHELPVIETYSDHRMAMAFAPVSVFLPGIVIRDAEVVNKSYPTFWADLEAVGFTLLDGDQPMPEIPNEIE